MPLRWIIGVLVSFVASATVTFAADVAPWNGFYTRAAPPSLNDAAKETDICVREIHAAQRAFDIPDNLLLAIGLQEAGRKMEGRMTVWPWTGNAQGLGKYFPSKEALQSWVRQQQQLGVRSIDVGCMQVNQRWHAQHFASLEEAIEPKSNVTFAARFLRQLYSETGDWWEAAGRYHSSTPNVKARYQQRLTAHHKLAQSKANAAPAPARAASNERAQPGLGWSAELSGAGAQQARQNYSIYSVLPIGPLLASPAQEP